MFDWFSGFFDTTPVASPAASLYSKQLPVSNGGDSSAESKDYSNYAYRMMSYKLYDESPVFKGLCDAMINLCVNEGLVLDSNIVNSKDLNEEIEGAWNSWCRFPEGLDAAGSHGFSVLERRIMKEAMLGGDVLVMLDYSNSFPQIKIISGGNVCSPSTTQGKNIHYGVEYDGLKEVAYYVSKTIIEKSSDLKGVNSDNITKVPAFDENGRRQAFLVRWQDKRPNELRGRPISLRLNDVVSQLDDYAKAELQSAKTNAKIALSVQRDIGADLISPKSTFAGARKRKNIQDVAPSNDPEKAKLEQSELADALVFDNLQPGEKLHAHDTSRTTLNFSNFYNTMLSIIARSEGIPPEVLKLEFTNTFSSSRAAFIMNDENIKVRRDFIANDFHNKYYKEWLISLAQQNKISGLSEFLEGVENNDWLVVGKYTNVKWQGYKRPPIDPVKQLNAVEKAISLGITTREKEANDYNGSEYTKNIQQQEAENVLWEKANSILEPAPVPVEPQVEEEEEEEGVKDE